MYKKAILALIVFLMCSMSNAARSRCLFPEPTEERPPWTFPPYLYYCNLDHDTYLEILNAQDPENQPERLSISENIKLALTVPLGRGVDQHIVVCSAYIAGREQGLNTENAINVALQHAADLGLDENMSIVAAQLAAERYDPVYENDAIAASVGYNDIECNVTSPTNISNFDMHLKCRCGLGPRTYAAVQWKSQHSLIQGINAVDYMEQILDYTIFNGGNKDQAVCAGYYGEILNLGFYFTTAIEMVVDASAYACTNEEHAREEVEKYATEDQPWFSP